MNNPLTAYINSLLDATEARMDRAGIPRTSNSDAVLQDGTRVASRDPVGVNAGSIPAVGTTSKPCRLVPCPHCNASGYAPFHERGSEREEWCTHCKGSAQILTDGGEL